MKEGRRKKKLNSVLPEGQSVVFFVGLCFHLVLSFLSVKLSKLRSLPPVKVGKCVDEFRATGIGRKLGVWIGRKVA